MRAQFIEHAVKRVCKFGGGNGGFGGFGGCVLFRPLGKTQHLLRPEDASPPPNVLEAYGAKPGQASLANNCLLARRLVEQGVRFVHLFDWGWDFHGTGPGEDIRDGLTNKAATFDRPAAALTDPNACASALQ